MPPAEQFMERAMTLAAQSTGYASPNPLVGCVIVKDSRIIAEGRHEKYGEAHAEVNALNNISDELAEGSDLYVNLEPCSHFGKTPPCTDLIISKKIKNVFISNMDPNPLVAGNGINKLKQAGINVVTGILEEKGTELNRFFFHHITHKSPYVTIKAACTLDGFIAMKNYESKWITGEEARKDVHRLRAEHDAVMVGSSTIIKDNPALDVREVTGRNPYRIILSSMLHLPLSSKVFSDENRDKSIIICSNEAYNIQKVKEFENAGLKIMTISADSHRRLNVKDALARLYSEYGICSVLAEGGSHVFSYLAENSLYNEMIIYYAPKITGSGISSFQGLNVSHLSEARTLRIKRTELIGPDLKVTLVKQ